MMMGVTMVTEHNNDDDDKGSRQSSKFPTACILRYYDRQTDHPWLIIILINVKGGSSSLVIVVIIIPCMFAPPILLPLLLTWRSIKKKGMHTLLRPISQVPPVTITWERTGRCVIVVLHTSMLLLNESCNVYIAVELENSEY